MSKLSKIIYFFTTLIFFMVFDIYFTGQILKYGYKLGENPVLDFVFIQNEGAAFSILQNSRLFLIIFGISALGVILYYAIKLAEKYTPMTMFFMSLLSSGIFCNLYERIRFGYVRDYVKLNFIDFPIFNISDVFICLSVFAIVIVIIKNNYYKKI